MRRSGTCMMIGSLFLALSSSAQALKPQRSTRAIPLSGRKNHQSVSTIQLALRSIHQLGVPELGR